MEPGHNEKHRRRIPQTLRRRALVSCDRCKKRRARCLRSPDASPDDACQSCIEAGIKCEATLPRKHRIYGSIETLSVRYRALDALVKGLFPNDNTEDTDILFHIAESRGIPMPSSDDQSPAEQALNLSPYSLSANPAHHSIVASSTPCEGNPFASRPNKVAEEKLIPTAHGVSHYIGPSSSFSFAFAVRNMVAERHMSQDWPDREHVALQSDFAGLRTSKALEPLDSDKPQENVAGLEFAGETGESRPQKAHPLPSPKKDVISSFLPAREVADALVEAFFEHVHPNYLLFHRGTFQLRYESIWTAQHIDIEPGWICGIFMVFAFGAQALEHHDKEQAKILQHRYLSLVQLRLHHLVNTTSLINIQALLLLQLLQHNASERNSAWILLGCASRMAISLGMHREGATGGFDPIERQVRRRVWWTLYMFEQNLCMVLGRPSSINDLEVSVSLPNETMLDGSDCVPPGYIDYYIRLIQVSSQIKHTIYPTPISRLQQDELPKPSLAKQLLRDLATWHRSLPPHLCPQSNSLVLKQRRAVLLLHIHYYHTQTLVTRPYVLRKVNLELARQSGREPVFPDMDADELSLSHACGTASRQAVILFQELATRGILDGVAWVDVYYAYHGILVLSLDFLARNRDTEDSSEDLARKAAVRDVVHILCSAKLCPTFHILAQVAVQFAKIVGILDEEALAHEAYVNTQSQPPIEGDIAGMIHEWFQPGLLEFPYDLFGIGGDAEVQHNLSYQPPTTFGNTFGGVIAGLGLDDSSTSVIERLIPSNSSFADWNSLFVQNDSTAPGGGHMRECV